MSKLQSEKPPNCPTCKTASLMEGAISRNLALESMISRANANVVCPSCNALTPFASYAAHKNVCFQMECPCRYMERTVLSVGDCDPRCARVAFKDLEKHLKEVHGVDAVQQGMDMAKFDLVEKQDLLETQSYLDTDVNRDGIPFSYLWGKDHGICMLLKTQFLPPLLIRIWQEVRMHPVKVGIGISVKIMGPRNFQLPSSTLYLVTKFHLLQTGSGSGDTVTSRLESVVRRRFDGTDEMHFFMNHCALQDSGAEREECYLSVQVEEHQS